MKRLLTILLVLLFFAALWLERAAGNPAPTDPPSPAEDGTLPALTSIAGHGLMGSHAYTFLEELSDEIGGRVTGSAAAAKAVEWGLAKMKGMGLENVHPEKWQLSRGWTRLSASAELLGPVHRALTLDSLGWVGSTPAGGVEAEVVPVNRYRWDEEIKNHSAGWSGKALLIVSKGEAPKDRDEEYGKFDQFLREAQRARAAVVIGGQGGSKAEGMRLTHTGAVGFDTYYEIPVVSMAPEDQELLERLVDHGRLVRLKVDVQNRVTDGPVESANVVGEIRGSEHPEQVVVVGGHLDSWDLAEGTTDDGTGVASVLGAAEAILAGAQKPIRTIRFVLFTGEEQGLLGSLAYAKTHKEEMAQHLAAIILDNGQGPVVGFNLGGRNDLIPALKKFAVSAKSFGELAVDDSPLFWTDTGPFILAGLPGINMSQDSPDYRYTHHSAVDTLDKVKPDLLTRNATLMALTAFWIAARPERLAKPWTPEQTAKMLVDKKQDKLLKAFGLWPFGNLGTGTKKN